MPLAPPVSPPAHSSLFTACCSPEFARLARDSPEAFLVGLQWAFARVNPVELQWAVERALAVADKNATSHTSNGIAIVPKMDENVRRLLQGWLRARCLPPKPAALVASTAVGFQEPTVGCTSLHE